MLILYIKFIYQSQLLDTNFNIILKNQIYSTCFDDYIYALDEIYIVIYMPAI